MKKPILIFTGIDCLIFCIFLILALKYHGVCFDIAITAGTIAYHFLMRLAVSFFIIRRMDRKKEIASKKRFAAGDKEYRFYVKLKVKQWKKFMPTYDRSLFRMSLTEIDDLERSMVQAELVHLWILPLNFVSLLFTFFTNEPEIYLWIFCVTAFLAALTDIVPIIIQRFNLKRLRRIRYHRSGSEKI